MLSSPHPALSPSVVFREIIKDIERGLVFEASQSGSIVVGDEVENVSISFLMVFEASVLSTEPFGPLCEMFGKAAVEAFGHAVGLRTVGSRQLVLYAVLAAEPVDEVGAGRFAFQLSLFVIGEAVGPFAAIVGKNGVNTVREVFEEAGQKGLCGGGFAVGQNLQIDIPAGPVDGDERVGWFAPQAGEVFDVEMDEAKRVVGFEAVRLVLGGRWFLGNPVAFQRAVDGAARKRRIGAAVHDLDDIVEREGEFGAQFADQSFLDIAQAGCQGLGTMRAVGDGVARSPSSDRALIHSELFGKCGNGRAARLDVSPYPRRRRRIGVQLYVHRSRHSLAKVRPLTIPTPSCQTFGTKHPRRGKKGGIPAI